MNPRAKRKLSFYVLAGRMIDRFEENQWADKSLLVHVSRNGRLSIRGTLSQKN